MEEIHHTLRKSDVPFYATHWSFLFIVLLFLFATFIFPLLKQDYELFQVFKYVEFFLLGIIIGCFGYESEQRSILAYWQFSKDHKPLAQWTQQSRQELMSRYYAHPELAKKDATITNYLNWIALAFGAVEFVTMTVYWVITRGKSPAAEPTIVIASLLGCMVTSRIIPIFIAYRSLPN